MNRKRYTEADEKCLAMVEAYTALVLTLIGARVIQMDALQHHLIGVNLRLERIGETGAARFLASLREALSGMPIPPGGDGSPRDH